MSYVVQIWDASRVSVRPAGVKEAVALVTALHRERPGINPNFVALVQRLTQRYPDLADVLAEGDEDAECAWSDGPLDGRTESGVFRLGLNVALLEEVRPFVIEQAKTLGLCVLDEQAGEAWLANGTVLRLAKTVAVPVPDDADDDEPPKTRELVDLVFERLKVELGSKGYTARKRDRSFIREHAEFRHEISVFASADRWPVHAQFCMIVTSRFHKLADLVCAVAYPEMLPEIVDMQWTTNFLQATWMDDEKHPFLGVNKTYYVHTRSEIERVLAHLMLKLETRILPLLRQCETLEGVAEIVFQEPVSHSNYGWNSGGATAIMLAYLMNRPDLNDICETLLKRNTKNPGGLEHTKLCIDYIRSHPLRSA